MIGEQFALKGSVPRFRLRFLLQELELVGPELILGRSPECHVTIEDPLVSRRHARIRLNGPQPTISDLGSRNGVRLNGELIVGEAALSHDDRVRLGTQDLVFIIVDEDRGTRQSRTTGKIRQCLSCERPFPGECSACPHCGAPVSPSVADRAEFDTLTGLVVEPEAGWAFQLLGEVVERSLSAGRVVEADRALQRAAREIDARLRNNRGIDNVSLSTLSSYALRLAQLQGRLEWVRWVLDLYKAHGAMFSSELVDCVENSSPPFRQAIHAEVATYLDWWRATHVARASDADKARAQRLAETIED
jgi:hypothetical protein